MATGHSRDVITGTMSGQDDTIKAIKMLGVVGFKAAVSAERVTGKDVLDTVRRNTPVRFGALVQSFIYRLKIYSSGTIAAIIGVNRGYTMPDPEHKKRNTSGMIIPAKYIHLVEFGTKFMPGIRPLTSGLKKSGSPDDLLARLRVKLGLAIKREERKAKKVAPKP